jgi:hypothetical protein
MDENQKSDIGIMEKLALIADGVDNIFPNGTVSILFSLNEKDFKTVQSNFREIDRGFKQFKIDMSGVEMLFISDELLKDELNTSSETPS